MYKIIIGDKSFNIGIEDKRVEIDGKAVDLDLSQLGPNKYNLIFNYKSYNLEVVSQDKHSGEVAVKVNNRLIKVVVKTALDKLLSKMGLNNNNVAHTKDIGAPMPGLILDVVVKEGDEVVKGDKLLVLEAMKMENIIKSPGSGKVKSIVVSKGDSVDSGQKLIHFE
jgi:biotin carboxyl carrier protein